jgi:putative peptide zinc metalloprotease protein
MERILTLYAYGTWLYRFILFTGIAFMVYHLFFKSLGIILFLIEIYIFIAKPILAEITQWWKQRELIGCNGHVVTTLLVSVTLLGALFVPFSSTLVVPAQLGAMERHRVFVPFPAQLEQIHVQDGQEVRQGELLFTLASEHLDARSKMVKLQIEALRVQLQRELGAKHKIETTAVTQQRLTAALVEAQGLEKKRQQLQIHATLPGLVEQLPAGIQPGCWVGVTQMLCQVVSLPGEKIIGSIAEADLALLPENVAGRFYANGGDIARVPCAMTFLDSSDQEVLEPAMLASIYGGDVAVIGHGEAALHPLQNRYRIEFTTSAVVETPTSMRGNVVLKGKALSLASRCWRSLAPGLIRESQL